MAMPSSSKRWKTQAYDLIRRINAYIAYLRKSKQSGDE